MKRSNSFIIDLLGIGISLVVFLLFLLVWYTPLLANQLSSFDFPGKSTGDLAFDVDVYQFQGENKKTNLEVAYSIDLSQFSIPKIQTDTIRFLIKLEVDGSRLENLIKIEKEKRIPFNRETSNEKGYFYFNLERFSIEPDAVRLHFEISDLSGSKRGLVNYNFNIKKFSNGLSVSDIVFIKPPIQRSEAKSPFIRRGIMMIPNPSRLYNITDSNQFILFYFEINNLSFAKDYPSTYSLFYKIYDLMGNEVLSKKYESLPVNASNIPRLERIDLEDISPGVYKFIVYVTDLRIAETVKIQKYFRIHSNTKSAELILPMTEKDIKKYYNQIKYLASEAELNVFNSLDPKGKQAFLLKFWKSRDPNPDTPENEFMVEYFSKMDYCEEHFKGGIDSDMGRIYMKYGPPLDIKRIVSTTQFTKPVEIWTYAQGGHFEFVFVDRTGDNKYILVHSTHPDEYHNPDWEMELK